MANFALRSVVSTADLGVLTAGSVEDRGTGLRHGYPHRLDATGKTLWCSLATTPDGRRYTSAVSLVDRIWVAGTVQDSKTRTKAAFRGAMDCAGSWQWVRNFGATNSSQPLTGLTKTSNGGIVFAYMQREPGTPIDRVNLVVTHPWGHTICLTAGACSTKNLDDCDDNNPCTVDLCDAKGGFSNA